MFGGGSKSVSPLLYIESGEVRAPGFWSLGTSHPRYLYKSVQLAFESTGLLSAPQTFLSTAAELSRWCDSCCHPPRISKSSPTGPHSASNRTCRLYLGASWFWSLVPGVTSPGWASAPPAWTNEAGCLPVLGPSVSPLVNSDTQQ